MFGKLSSGLKSAGVELPKEVQQLGSAAESLEKGGFNAETVTDSLKDVLETKTEADPETKKELNGKLDKLTGFLKSGSLSPTLIATLVPLGQAITSGEWEKAKTLAGKLVTGDDAGKNLAVIGEVLKLVKT